MIISRFMKEFVIFLIILSLILFGLHKHHLFSAHSILSIWSLVGFTIMTVLIFILGQNFSRSKNKFLYNNLIVMNFILKLMVSILVVYVFVKQYDPEGKLYLIPFVLIYLAFTVFETYFMMKQAKG